MVLMQVLFGYHTNNNNQQSLPQLKTMIIHCRWCNVIMYIEVSHFLCFYPCSQANKQQHNKTHTDIGSSVIGYAVMRENCGKKERGRRKKEVRKGCNECALCTMSKNEMNGSYKRVCNILLGCAQWQSISNSVQIRAANVCHTWYVVIFYIFLPIIHTQISHTDGWIISKWERYITRKQRIQFEVIWVMMPQQRKKNKLNKWWLLSLI